MNIDYHNFLKLSSELTGYSIMDLKGTGLLNAHGKLVEDEIGEQVITLLYYSAKSVLNYKTKEERNRAMRINIMASPTLWPICTSIITLWYLGQWNSMSPFWYKYYAHTDPEPGVIPGNKHVPSVAAYTQQLAYKAAGAHPPGAHPTGFGSWGIDPVFGDFITTK